jgi:uncharacterized membrane protein YGL010W
MVTVTRAEKAATTMATATTKGITKRKKKWHEENPLCWSPPVSASLLLAHAACAVVGYVMVKAALQFNDKESALAFYGVYHREPINQVIHFVGVPGIIFSLFAFQFHVGPLFYLVPLGEVTVKAPGIPAHSVNWATLYAAFYAAFYFSVDRWGAALYAPVLYAMYAAAARWTLRDRRDMMGQSSGSASKQANWSWQGTGRVLRAAGWVHVLSWYAQIHWGHKMAEGAQPAVAQSLGGALTTAPLFAFYELVWAAGYRQSLHRDVKRLVDQYTLELCAQGVDMRACNPIVDGASDTA